MVLQTWGDVFIRSFQNVWLSVAYFFPRLIVALIIFFIGWAIAVSIGQLLRQVIRSLKVDNVLEKLGLKSVLARGGLPLDSGAFIGGLVKWFIIIVFLLTATDILGLNQITVFLRSVVEYLPNVIVAAVILLAATLVGDVVYKVVKASAEAAHFRGAFIAGVAKWAILLFAFLTAMAQLRLPGIETFFTGLVAMLAIAGGLAFGLGGKDHASAFLDRMKRDITG